MRNPIFDIDNWREIGATLARNKTRTFLTAFGIFWGTAMLAILWGGAGGLKGLLMRNFDGFATNMCVMWGGRTTISYRGYNKGMRWSLTDKDIDEIRRIVPHIKSSSVVASWNGTASYGTRSRSGVNCNGVEADYQKIHTPIIFEGRFISDADVSKNSKVAVIGKDVANELFGSESPLGKHVALNGIYFTIIGVAGQKGEVSIGSRIDESLTVPSTTLRRIANYGNQVGFLVFEADAGHTPSELLPAINRVVQRNHPISPDDNDALQFFDVSEQFAMVDNLFLGVSILALVVGAGSLIAGIIGVGNIMWIIVKERTQEIGIRRAIGAKPRDVIVQILSEGVVLTAVAGMAGISLGTIVLAVAERLTVSPLGSAGFNLQLSNALVIMATFLVLGSCAGLIPAVKAMRIKPIEALNDK